MKLNEDQPHSKMILITPEEKEEGKDQEHEVFYYLIKRAREVNGNKNATNISKKVYPERKLNQS